MASRTAFALYDDELGHQLAVGNVRLARDAGALMNLPAALVALPATLVLGGKFA